MTPDDRQVIYGLVFIPARGRQGSPEDVLRHFGMANGQALGLRLLRDAVDRQDGLDVEAALIVCATFDITADHLALLVRLASADWHRKHEDVATALDHLRTSAAVDALCHLHGGCGFLVTWTGMTHGGWRARQSGGWRKRRGQRRRKR